MKKRYCLFGSLVSLVVPIATIVSCSKSKTTKVESTFNKTVEFKGEKNTTKKIGAMMTDPENPRWVKAKEFAQIYGNKVFKSAKVNIVKKQNEQNEWIKTNKDNFDGLIISPTDDSASSAFDDWIQAKPVVVFDKLIKLSTNSSARNSYNWYVTYDSKKVGLLQGLFIVNKIYGTKFEISDISDPSDPFKNIIDHIKANKLSKEKHILTLAGDPADNNAKLFFNGAMKLLNAVAAVDAKFVIPTDPFTIFKNVAQEKWDYAKGQTFLQAQITKMNKATRAKITAILSPNDLLAKSAINALNKNGIDPMTVIITGQDSNDIAILSIAGESNLGQDMTIAKPDSKSMAIAVALLNELIKNSKKYNVKPSNLGLNDRNELITKIKTAFPGINIVYDATYETATGKTINTILLTPQVITKDQIGAGKSFEIVKS